MVRSVVRPCIKNTYGKNDSNNYCEIISLKSLNIVLHLELENAASLSSNQFRYRKFTSTHSAVTLAKETVHNHLYKDSVVYICLLDPSKTFERVDHNILKAKLENVEL